MRQVHRSGLVKTGATWKWNHCKRYLYKYQINILMPVSTCPAAGQEIQNTTYPAVRF